MSISKTLGYIAACGVLALGLASAPPANSVPFTYGTMNGFDDTAEDGGLPVVDLLAGTQTFTAVFTDGDDAGNFWFNLWNSSGSTVAVSLLDATVTQSDPAGTDFFLNGVDFDFDGALDSVAQHTLETIELMATLAPNEVIRLLISYGDPHGDTGTQSGPQIGLTLQTSVVPLPAGLVLFLSGLAGIGFLGRYKAKRREPAVA